MMKRRGVVGSVACCRSPSFPAAKLNRYAAFLTLHGDLQSQRRDKRKTRVTGYGYRREDALAWKWRNDINEHE